MTHEALRQAREEKGWSLEELARRSGLRPKTIELIDQGLFEELPAGLYCRSSIRNYASAVGLKPDHVLEALAPLLPTIEDPLDGLARRHGHARKAEARVPEPAAARPPIQVALLPEPEAESDFEPLALTRAEPIPVADLFIVPADTTVDEVESLPEILDVAEAADNPRPWWRSTAATAVDGVLLIAMGTALVWLTARTCGTTMPVALRLGGPAIGLVFALIVTLYFVLFGGVGNATPGVRFMRLEVRPSGRTVLNAREVFGRARRSVLHDSSLLAD